MLQKSLWTTRAGAWGIWGCPVVSASGHWLWIVWIVGWGNNSINGITQNYYIILDYIILYLKLPTFTSSLQQQSVLQGKGFVWPTEWSVSNPQQPLSSIPGQRAATYPTETKHHFSVTSLRKKTKFPNHCIARFNFPSDMWKSGCFPYCVFVKKTKLDTLHY